ALFARGLERRFRQIGSDATPAYGRRYARVGDKHHIIAQLVVEHAELAVLQPLKAASGRVVFNVACHIGSRRCQAMVSNSIDQSTSMEKMPRKHPPQNPTIGQRRRIEMSVGSRSASSRLA